MVVEGAGGDSHLLMQSQGDSRWVRSPLDSNLGEAVEEGQHGRGHAGVACRGAGQEDEEENCSITTDQTKGPVYEIGLRPQEEKKDDRK